MPINFPVGRPVGNRLENTSPQQVCAQSVPQTEEEYVRRFVFQILLRVRIEKKNDDDEEPFNTDSRHVISVFFPEYMDLRGNIFFKTRVNNGPKLKALRFHKP